MWEVYMDFLYCAIRGMDFWYCAISVKEKDGKGTKYVDGRDNRGLCWTENYQIRRRLLMEFLKNESLVKAFEFSLINLIPKKHANEISQ